MFKKLFVTSALIASVAAPASAVPLRDSDLLSPEAAEYHSKTGDIAAIALGVLISALEADRRGDGRGGRGRDDNMGRGPDRGRDGRRGPGRDRDRDDWGRGRRREPQYVCYAENARRQLFSETDRSARYAQDEAIRSCYRVSRRCRPLGCREIR